MAENAGLCTSLSPPLWTQVEANARHGHTKECGRTQDGRRAGMRQTRERLQDARLPT